MKGGLNIIRWKFVIPAGVLLAAVVLFFVFFFDPIAGHILSSVASKVNGAKVDVDGFHTKFFKGRVDVAHVAVTDRENPMTNVVETGALSFQLDPGQAARMRFVINDAALHDLQFGTQRKTSGALPRAAKKEEKAAGPGPAEKLANKYEGRFKVSLAGMKSDVKKKIEFDPKETAVYKRSTQLQESAKGLPAAWQKRVDDLKAEERLAKIQAELDEIKKTPTSGPQALTAVPESLKKLNETRAELAKLQSDVKATRDAIDGDLKTFRQNTLSLNEAKKQDADNLMSRLNLDFADPQRLMESVIGPTVVARFRTILKYLQLAREHMPPKKKKEEQQTQPRAGGTNIEFPTPAAPPRFWLQKAALDGKYQAVTATGQMSDLTTDPARAGRPFKLTLNGAQGAQRYALNAVLDHVTEVARDGFVLKASGVDLASVAPATTSLLKGGSAAADIALNLIGEGGIGGNFNLALTGAKMDHAAFRQNLDVPTGNNLSGEDKVKATFAENLAGAIEALPQITVTGQLFGTWDDPSVKLTSNLTDTFAGVVKSSVGSFVKDQRADVEAKLDALTSQEKGKLDGIAKQLDAQTGDRLGKIEGEVNQKISQAAGINLGGAGGGVPLKAPSLKKLFK